MLLQRLGLNTSRESRRDFDVARGCQRHAAIDRSKIRAKSRLAHSLGAQTKSTHNRLPLYRSRAVTGTRRCPARTRRRARIIPIAPSRRHSLDLERVLRSPPSFPFPPPINNFIRRSYIARKREVAINYRAAAAAAAARRSRNREVGPDLDALRRVIREPESRRRRRRRY